MVSVARRNQVVAFINRNVTEMKPNPEYKAITNADYADVKAAALNALPTDVQKFLLVHKHDYHVRQVLSNIEQEAITKLTNERGAQTRLIPNGLNKGALIRRAVAATTEEELAAIFSDIKEAQGEFAEDVFI